MLCLRLARIFVNHFKFLKSVVPQGIAPKITIPSPSTLHFRGGRAAVDREAYSEMTAFYADLARVYSEEVRAFAQAGCRYLQIDEVNLAFLCDPRLREEIRTTIGEDPDVLPHTYAKLINASIATRPKDMVVCLHLCRGNAMSSWLAQGGYDPVAEVLFNEVGVDGFFLEYDTSRAGSFEPLRFVPRGKTVVLGLVTSKTGVMEPKDALKRRIDEASRFCPLEQLSARRLAVFNDDHHSRIEILLRMVDVGEPRSFDGDDVLDRHLGAIGLYDGMTVRVAPLWDEVS